MLSFHKRPLVNTLHRWNYGITIVALSHISAVGVCSPHLPFLASAIFLLRSITDNPQPLLL